MHFIQKTFQEWTDDLSTIPHNVLSKVQCFFYFVFPLISLACVVLTVITRREDAGLIVIAVLSALYESVMCCYCMERRVKLGYGLWLHNGVAMIFLGFIALEYGKVPATVILCCCGFISISVVCLGVYLNHDVLVERDEAGVPVAPPNEQNLIQRDFI